MDGTGLLTSLFTGAWLYQIRIGTGVAPEVLYGDLLAAIYMLCKPDSDSVAKCVLLNLD